MPPIDYITERGPFQHGETLKGFRLRPRVIQMLMRHNYPSRDRLLAGRMQILDVLRPNRQVVGVGPNTGILRHSFKDGTKLDLNVIIQSGPGFQPAQADTWDEFSWEDVIRFIAFDPIFFNPYRHDWPFINIVLPNGTRQDTLTLLQLVFPTATGGITFPVGTGITFNRNIGIPGIGGGAVAPTIDPNVLNYLGNWFEYPTIVLSGPLDSPIIITNTTTNETIRLNYSVQPGETVTIVLAPGAKSITSSTYGTSVSLMGFLSSDSALGTFHLEPGVNNFQTVFAGQDTNSVAKFQYYDRYVGY